MDTRPFVTERRTHLTLVHSEPSRHAPIRFTPSKPKVQWDNLIDLGLFLILGVFSLAVGLWVGAA